MTRFANPSIYVCPKCGGYVTHCGFASMNFMGMKRWSDGYVSAFLAPSSISSFGRCPLCKQLFWREDAEEIGMLPDSPAREEEWRSPFKLWLLRKLRMLDAHEIKKMEVWKCVPEDWKNASAIEYPNNADLWTMLADTAALTIEREIFLRNQLRWLGNDRGRGEQSERATNLHWSDIPAEKIRDNLLRLYDLHSAQEQPDIFTLAEILRELGRFDEAIEMLLSIQAEKSEIGMKVLELARAGDSRVCLISQDKSIDW